MTYRLSIPDPVWVVNHQGHGLAGHFVGTDEDGMCHVEVGSSTWIAPADRVIPAALTDADFARWYIQIGSGADYLLDVEQCEFYTCEHCSFSSTSEGAVAGHWYKAHPEITEEV